MSVKNDYKPDSTWKTRQQVRYHGLLVIILVLVGMFGSLLAYIGKYRPATPAEPSVKAQSTPKSPAEPSASATVGKPKYDFYTVLPQRQVVISKDEVKERAPTKQQEAQTASTDKVSTKQPPPTATVKPTPPPAPTKVATRAASTAEQAALPPAQSKRAYFVQVGSFRNYAEADRRKASVAFLGISARIEAGTGTDGSPLHRVRIGPIKDQDQLQALLQRLQENNIPSVTVRN